MNAEAEEKEIGNQKQYILVRKIPVFLHPGESEPDNQIHKENQAGIDLCFYSIHPESERESSIKSRDYACENCLPGFHFQHTGQLDSYQISKHYSQSTKQSRNEGSNHSMGNKTTKNSYYCSAQ